MVWNDAFLQVSNADANTTCKCSILIFPSFRSLQVKYRGHLNRKETSKENSGCSGSGVMTQSEGSFWVNLVSVWPQSGQRAPEAKTECRFEMRILFTKEPTQEVSSWMPAEFKPQTHFVFMPWLLQSLLLRPLRYYVPLTVSEAV